MPREIEPRVEISAILMYIASRWMEIPFNADEYSDNDTDLFQLLFAMYRLHENHQAGVTGQLAFETGLSFAKIQYENAALGKAPAIPTDDPNDWDMFLAYIHQQINISTPLYLQDMEKLNRQVGEQGAAVRFQDGLDDDALEFQTGQLILGDDDAVRPSVTRESVTMDKTRYNSPQVILYVGATLLDTPLIIQESDLSMPTDCARYAVFKMNQYRNAGKRGVTEYSHCIMLAKSRYAQYISNRKYGGKMDLIPKAEQVDGWDKWLDSQIPVAMSYFCKPRRTSEVHPYPLPLTTIARRWMKRSF